MRILFFGDGHWATLSLRQLVRDHQILGIVLRTSPTDPGLAQAAREFNLPVFSPPKVNASTFLDLIRRLSPELNLSVSYDQIIRRDLFEMAPLGFVNFHAGKLPLYRGRNVLNWALINGEEEIGITGHFIDDGIDTGDIIIQATVPILWEDTYAEVLQKVTNRIPQVVADAVRLLSSGTIAAIPQRHLVGSYFPARKPGDEWIDWQGNSRNIYNKIRAITRPGPGARTVIGENEVVLWKAHYEPDWPRYIANPGQVVGKGPRQGALVKTSDSFVEVMEIQLGDKAPEIPIWPIGTCLGYSRVPGKPA